MFRNDLFTRRPEYKILARLTLGLIAWAVFHAVGAYFFNYNPLRPLVVLACMAAFLSFWWLLLLSRNAKIDREERR